MIRPPCGLAFLIEHFGGKSAVDLSTSVASARFSSSSHHCSQLEHCMETRLVLLTKRRMIQASNCWLLGWLTELNCANWRR